MTIRRIVPNIQSAQMDKSLAFYTDFLGMEVAMDMGWIVTFVSPDNPTAQNSVVQTEEETAKPAGLLLTGEVADVDAAHARAQALGIEIVYPLTSEPLGVRRFHVVNPNGVLINVMSHIVGKSAGCSMLRALPHHNTEP